MRLSDLETLVAAVREGSLSAAARRLFLTQPAVSARLRRLEREVGEPLLRRSGQGVCPTSAGQRLCLRATSLLAELRRLEAETKGPGELSGTLPLGATDLVAIDHLAPILRAFRARHPGVDLALHVEGTEPLVRLLRKGEIELALGTLPVRGPGLQTVPLFVDPLVVVAPPRHPMAQARRVDPRRLARESWISHKPDSITRGLVEGFFSSQGERLRVEMEISSPEAIKKLVQARLGLAALPWCSVRREVREGRLATVAVRGFRLQRTSGLILRDDLDLSRAAAALRDLLVSGPGRGRRPPLRR